jgi:hypothetical protein
LVRFVEKFESDPGPPQRIGRAEEAGDRVGVAEDEVWVGEGPVVARRDQPRAAGLDGGVRRLDRLLRDRKVPPDEDVDVADVGVVVATCVSGNSFAVHGGSWKEETVRKSSQ